ncbi:hypothetical protein [Halomonas sp. PA16-9]|uniref:hypothetical protein n=1 Tax=Halomonas sp. PA16-9 TaxID=2576841 RepID=UPI0018C6FD81
MLRTVIAITAALTASHALAQPTPDQAASNAFSHLQSLTQPSMGQGFREPLTTCWATLGPQPSRVPRRPSR